MAEYTLESFKDCLFNPLHKDVLKKYPVLSEVSTNERLLKYILCLYDPKSPLIRDYRNNVANRKREAARLAGYDLSKDVKFLEDLYSFQNKIAASSAIVFLRDHIHNMLWTMIVSHEQTFYEYNERLLKPVEDALSYTSINKEGSRRCRARSTPHPRRNSSNRAGPREAVSPCYSRSPEPPRQWPRCEMYPWRWQSGCGFHCSPWWCPRRWSMAPSSDPLPGSRHRAETARPLPPHCRLPWRSL